jgi:hypothetical protein
MSPTRTLELDSTQQQASLNDRTLAANLLDAIRTGRIRIVDPPAGNAAFCPR